MTITPKDEYDPIIPGPNDFLAVSQDDFLANFGQLYNAFARNHVALDDTVLTPGNHTNIELMQQGKGPETSVGEISLYSKMVSDQTNQLFLRYQGGSASGKEVQVTTYQIYPAQNLAWQISYFTFLPGNIIVYFGVGDLPRSPNKNTIFFPPYVMSNVISCYFCAQSNNPAVSPTVTFNKDPFGKIGAANLFNIATGFSYFYLVIGNI
jgi:hypothetical protein